MRRQSNMSASSSRFFPRAPRYTLRAQDDNQMRFALMQTRGNALDTELRDVSKTGLKFTVPNAEVPHRGLDEGDMIKIEFKIPSGKQIACFATVVRVEVIEQWHPDFGDQSFTEVAVTFRQLPSLFAKALEKSLPGKESGEHSAIHISTFPEHMHRRALVLFSLSSVALFSLFMFLSTSPQQWLTWFSH